MFYDKYYKCVYKICVYTMINIEIYIYYDKCVYNMINIVNVYIL